MLRSTVDSHAHSVYGSAIQAKDGEAGRLRALFFDDSSWAVRYLVVACGEVPAATDHGLVVLDGDGLKPIASVDLGPTLHKKPIAEANLSGLAVGEEHVYLTLERKPYVLLVEKP